MDPVKTAPRRRARPNRLWILVTLIAGGAGAMGGIAAAGHGTYNIGAFRTEFRAWPAAAGKTELAIRAPALPQAHAEAGTHRAPIDFKATIVGLRSPSAADLRLLQNPSGLASEIGDEGRDAVKSFAIKLGILALAGGLGAGLVVSMGRWQRMLGGLLAGALTFAIVGLLVQQTYDVNQFSKTSFVTDRGNVEVPAVFPSP